MRRIIILSLLFFTLSSFQKRAHFKPLTQDQMVAMLVDLELVKAMVARYTDDEDAASQLLRKNVLLICQSHGIAWDAFQQSYRAYFSRLGVMKKIYEEVALRLEELAEQEPIQDLP